MRPGHPVRKPFPTHAFGSAASAATPPRTVARLLQKVLVSWRLPLLGISLPVQPVTPALACNVFQNARVLIRQISFTWQQAPCASSPSEVILTGRHHQLMPPFSSIGRTFALHEVKLSPRVILSLPGLREGSSGGCMRPTPPRGRWTKIRDHERLVGGTWPTRADRRASWNDKGRKLDIKSAWRKALSPSARVCYPFSCCEKSPKGVPPWKPANGIVKRKTTSCART